MATIGQMHKKYQTAKRGARIKKGKHKGYRKRDK